MVAVWLDFMWFSQISGAEMTGVGRKANPKCFVVNSRTNVSSRVHDVGRCGLEFVEEAEIKFTIYFQELCR
jgi:hypothetical protein